MMFSEGRFVGGVVSSLTPRFQRVRFSIMIFAPSFQSKSHVIHGFTVRVDAWGNPMDLGPKAEGANWASVAQDLGVPGWGTARVSQIHGAGVAWAEGPGVVGEADAIITDKAGFLIAVRTADCVPILVVGNGCVGAIHAGWRGLAAGVIPAAVEQMGSPTTLAAVVGPSICCGCYEVGEEVVEGISQWVKPALFVDRTRSRPHVDGGKAAVEQLRSAGISSVERLDLCTWCDPRFWSHRRDGKAAGRQAAVVGLR